MKKRSQNIPNIQRRKGKAKIVMLTAYDYQTARILNKCGIDIILVGDSVSTALLGHKTTLPMNMDQMLHHTEAVVRGAPDTLIIGDMPFGSYQTSQDEAVKNAISFIKAGTHGVKIEGAFHCELIRRLVKSGIPVMGHIGLIPQSIHIIGGYKIQGKNKETQELLLNDAKKLEKSGVFSLVIEGVPSSCAAQITNSISIPTIGIGAGIECDGQVLVISDILGLDPDFTPVFVKKYANLDETISQAVNEFKYEVRNKKFPGNEHIYKKDN